MNTNPAVVALPLARLALASAIGEIGQSEVPKGSNLGPRVEAYLASVGLSGGNAWCMAFVYWCYKAAAMKLSVQTPVYKTGGVLACWNNSPLARRITKKDALANPALVLPGAQFFLDFGGGHGHTGIVERIDGNIIHTIEGNSNDEGSREGYEVCRRERNLTDTLLKGFINYQ